jgi:hypothetical protein
VIFRIPYYEVKYNPDPENAPETEGPQRPEGEEERYSSSYWDRRERWIEATRKVVLPEPKVFRPLQEPPPFDLREEFGIWGLQVIVKLANIELTPEKPEYAGGTWHVEGQLVRSNCLLMLGVLKKIRMNISAQQRYTITHPRTSLRHPSHFANTLVTSRVAKSCIVNTSTSGFPPYSGAPRTGQRSRMSGA